MYFKTFRYLLALTGICLSFNLLAQDLPHAYYVAAAIPDSLKEEANSVVRYSMEKMVVIGPGKAVKQVHTIVTILNEKGESEAREVLDYQRKFNRVNAFEMVVYNADGILVKKYHKSDMYDRSAVDNETMVTDDRLLIIEHTIANYPVTIEKTYEIELKSLMNLGAWHYQDNEQSVQHSNYQITIGSDAGFRFLNKNTTVKPEKVTVNGLDTYTWSVKNLKAFKMEDGAEAWRVFPAVFFSANVFEYYSLPGNFQSWQNFGKWILSLNADVNSLTPQRAEEIRKMTADIKSDKDKVKFLYEYMQHNMRYVSITLGIGGLKPFPATFVDEKKYGDCKALSNYMSALLKAVNIKSYYAIVRAGENKEPADPQFPFNSFNHVILCVPFKTDTTWLECTSSIMPFGQLGPFTENRNALLITEDGGKLVNTPKSRAQDNRFASETHVVLDADGGARAQLKILTSGEFRFEYISLTAQPTDRQKVIWMQELKMKQPSVFDLKPADDKDGVKEFDFDLEYDRFCDVSAGNKMFYKPAVFDLCNESVPVMEKRKSDFYFDFPMERTNTTTIDLPAGFEAETIPASVSLKFTYGNYEVNYAYNAAKNQVTSTSRFLLNNHVIPAGKYMELQQYMDNIVKAQNKKLVIKRKA
jgi:hypothetical protein